METGRRQTEGMQKRSSTPAMVVVVKDDPFQLALLCDFIQKTGLDAHGFQGAAEALGAMSIEQPPALIITDLYMQGLDGWQFCRLLRSTEYPAFNQVPILVVSTTFAGEEPKRIAAALGVYAFLSAPLNNDVFIQQVLSILRGQRTSIPLRALIIDSNKHQAALLGDAFAAEGYTADTALTVQEANEAIARTTYDVTVIDQLLPDGGGDGLLERFRTEHPACVCIMMATKPEPTLTLGWMNSGAAACVRKPVEPAYLLTLCDQTRRERSLMHIEDQIESRTRALRESQKRFKALADNAYDAIIMMNADGAIDFWNPAAVRIFGYASQAVMGKRPHDLLAPQGHHDECQKIFSRSQKTDTGYAGDQTVEFLARSKDGREILIELSLSVMQLSDGWHTVCISRDITERKATEESLRESEKNISSVLNSIDAAVMSYSIKQERFIYVSPSTEKIYGRTIDECIRNKFSAVDHVHPDDENILHAITTRMTEHGTAEGECRIIRPDESIVWVHVYVKLIRDKDGEPDRIDRVINDITERKDLELQLLKSNAEQDSVLNSIDDIVMFGSIDDNRCNYLSPSFEKIFGINKRLPLQTLHQWAEFVHPDDVEIVYNHIIELSEYGRAEHEFRVIKPDGKVAWLRARTKLIPNENGTGDKIIRILSDITNYKEAEQERENLQKQLLQSQKMESVGRLAGGVAHDFNNMLSVIIGQADLALRCLSPGQPMHKTFTQICKTAERAGVLTHQLLAFAGKQAIAPEVLDMNDSIEGMLTMLRRLIGDHIDLVWQPGGDLDPVKMDPSQINHVLAEVCLNAKDALVDSGTITITTAEAAINQTLCNQQPGLVQGEYITLTISDDGQGMDNETLANIFEPFFTHKDMGKGQGLGMATVYGIIEQNNGFINIASEPGVGTCVTIYLPRHANAAPLSLVNANKNKTETAATPTTTIVLVEDEPENLEMYRTMLEGMGYTVLATGSPQECLQLAKSYTGRIDLLITDVVMPDMNGRELADEFIASNPATKCLFISGYSAEVITRNGVLVGGINFIEKPFSMQNFATKIKDVLNDPNNQYVSTTGNVISAQPIKPNKANQ